MVTGGGIDVNQPLNDILHSGFAFGPGMVYTSAGVNRRPECVACSLSTGLVYYASHNGVLIYDPSSTRFFLALTGTLVAVMHHYWFSRAPTVWVFHSDHAAAPQ